MPDWERSAREAAGREWDETVPRWSMPRAEFIEWHVRMARQTEERSNG